jgi:integrase
VLILVMGLRKGEVVGLPWSAVNLDRGELDIGWQLQRVRRQLLHRETKTEASEATLPMPGICVAALRIREKGQAAAKATAGASWMQSGLVFTTRAGTPFEPRNLNRRFETRCAKAGVRRITVHDMRHTCATLLEVSGVALGASFGRSGERALPAVQRAALEQARSHGSPCTCVTWDAIIRLHQAGP